MPLPPEVFNMIIEKLKKNYNKSKSKADKYLSEHENSRDVSEYIYDAKKIMAKHFSFTEYDKPEYILCIAKMCQKERHRFPNNRN